MSQNNFHLLEQVEKGYTRQENLKNILEDKATKIIISSSIRMALLFGFTNFIFLNKNLEFIFQILSIPIILSVILSISTIIINVGLPMLISKIEGYERYMEKSKNM